jgi:integrase
LYQLEQLAQRVLAKNPRSYAHFDNFRNFDSNCIRARARERELAVTRTPSKRHRGIYSYPTADGRRWGATVELDRDWKTGKRISKRRQGFRTQADAEAWRIEQQDKRRKGETVAPSLTPLGIYLAEWLAGRIDIAASTVRGYEAQLARITATLGSVPLARLTPRMIETCYADLVRSGLRSSTVNASHRILSQALKDAVRLRLLPANPVEHVKPPSAKPGAKVVYDIEQMRTLLDGTAQDAPWGLVWRVLAETWVRIGELLSLRWEAVDCTQRTVRIDRGKTAAAARTIPISAALADALRKHQDGERFRASSRGQQWSDRRPVFANDHGQAFSRPHVANQLAKACARLGLPVVTPHEIRHSGGSIAYRSGMPIKTISERMGHRNITTTLAIYTHTDLADHRDLGDKIGALLG